MKRARNEHMMNMNPKWVWVWVSFWVLGVGSDLGTQPPTRSPWHFNDPTLDIAKCGPSVLSLQSCALSLRKVRNGNGRWNGRTVENYGHKHIEERSVIAFEGRWFSAQRVHRRHKDDRANGERPPEWVAHSFCESEYQSRRKDLHSVVSCPSRRPPSAPFGLKNELPRPQRQQSSFRRESVDNAVAPGADDYISTTQNPRHHGNDHA